MLSAQHVGFAYGRRRPTRVVDDLSWVVPTGKITLLLGPNGAGKSTLLKLLSGFHRPQRGSVTWQDADDTATLFEHVGWMPQDIQPARGLTAKEQTAYAGWVGGLTHREAERRADLALEAVDLAGQARAKATSLSGGQLRRLGLAQTIVRPADVLLLDEPTAGLDPAQTLKFRRVIASLPKNAGIVISTHLVNELAEDADHIVVLDHGAICFEGSPEQMLTARGGAGDGLAGAFRDLIGGGDH